jgi:hypothetical protein
MKFIVFLFLLHEITGLYNIDRRQILKTVPLAINQNGEKFCKDCKFFKKDFFTETKYGHCSHFPLQQQTNDYLVDGYKDESPTVYYYCSTARSSDRMCGVEGKYFVSKNNHNFQSAEP